MTELDRDLEAARVVAQIHRDVRRRIEARRRREQRVMLCLALTFLGLAAALMGATWLPW